MKLLCCFKVPLAREGLFLATQFLFAQFRTEIYPVFGSSRYTHYHRLGMST